MTALRRHSLPAMLCAVVCLITVIPAQLRAAENQSLFSQYAAEIDVYRQSALRGDYGGEEKTQLMLQLLDELLSKLETRATVLVGGLPPYGEVNGITDFRVLSDGRGKYWAEWTYLNAGDYNLDGAVTVADIEAVLWNYGATAADENWESAQYCDGSGDGVVDIGDVALIADHLGSRIDRFRVVGHAYLSADEVRASGARDVTVLGTAPGTVAGGPG